MRKKIMLIFICFCILGLSGCRVDENFKAQIVAVNGDEKITTIPSEAYFNDEIRSGLTFANVQCFIPLVGKYGIHRIFQIKTKLLAEFEGQDHLLVNLELDLSRRYLKYRLKNDIIFESKISAALAEQLEIIFVDRPE